MAEREPPRLTIAAEQSAEELRKQQLLDDLRWPTREMVANLLRVMRGAGRPHQLPQQIIDLADAILEASKHSNAWGIWSVMEDVLHSAFPGREDPVGSARETIAKGALQFLASHIIGQSTQRSAGQMEIHDGIREMEAAWEKNRQPVKREPDEYDRILERLQKAARPKRRQIAPVKAAEAKRATPTRKKTAEPVASKPADDKPMSTAEYMKRRRAELRDRD